MNQPQNEIKGLDYRDKQKQQILAQVPASLEYPSSSKIFFEEVKNRAVDKEQALIAQINLNSIFGDQKKTSSQTSAPQENNTPENVLGSILQSGSAGGKIERSRQIFKIIQKTGGVSIDGNNLNIFVDQQDTSIITTF